MSTTKARIELAVVGGGAAGLAAAYTAASLGADVTVFEKNRKTGRKLRITGKGRCNVTNDCEPEEFLRNVPSNPRFLYSSIYGFTPANTKDLFEELGVPLKVERGKRVFPVSDNANDIADALTDACRRIGVRFSLNDEVTELTVSEGRICGLHAHSGERRFDAVIIATGGASYPLTGSTGDGYGFAEAAGHTVVPARPSLVPLTAGGICRACQGLSLKNIGFRIEAPNGKALYEDFGELMFAHFGLTGPVVLSASAHLPSDLSGGKYKAIIDLKPALDEKKLDLRIQSDFRKFANRDFGNALSELLPQKLIAPIVSLSGIAPSKKVNSVTREERETLVKLLKGLTVPLTGFRPIEEAIITKGGISVRELDPRTMESKLVPGLYFVGEVIDVDAYTGGFNLQIAFSTGVAAGRACVGASE